MSLNLPHGERFLPHGEKKSLTMRELVIDTLTSMNEAANFLNFNIVNKHFKILNPLPDG
jgi:hypothetical protein